MRSLHEPTRTDFILAQFYIQALIIEVMIRRFHMLPITWLACRATKRAHLDAILIDLEFSSQ